MLLHGDMWKILRFAQDDRPDFDRIILNGVEESFAVLIQTHDETGRLDARRFHNVFILFQFIWKRSFASLRMTPIRSSS